MSQKPTTPKIDGPKPRVDSRLVVEVVNALLAHLREERRQGKQSDASIYAQLQLNAEIAKKITKPVRVKIPNSLYFEGQDNICLFIRNEDKTSVTNYISSRGIAGVNAIYTLEEVRKNFKQFKDKRGPLSENSYLLCDSRMIHQLYSLIGKILTANNYFVVPVDFERADKMESAILKSVNSSYTHLKGQNITIKFGNSQLTANQIVDNIVCGLEFAVPKIKDEWRSVHSIHLKTATSPAMPIYSKQRSAELDFLRKEIDKKSTNQSSNNNGNTTVTDSSNRNSNNSNTSSANAKVGAATKNANKPDTNANISNRANIPKLMLHKSVAKFLSKEPLSEVNNKSKKMTKHK